jgi:cephalosporin-C deacetylase-like acetyl esterase
MLDASTFAYDAATPLDLSIMSERLHNGARIQDIAYKSLLSGKVSAYLVLPPTQPKAGLIFGHWGEGDRSEFVDEAVALTRLDVVSLCLDASFRRPAVYEPEEALPQADLQWILDVRRAVDLLQERFALSAQRLGYVGHSFGASFGGVIAGIERRIHAYVFMAGAARATEIMRASQHPLIVRERKQTPPHVWEAMLRAEEPYNACHYIGRASPAALLFQFARQDEFVPLEEAEYYFALASEPKRIAWYEGCGHELSAHARVDRATFLCEQLSLQPPSAAVEALLERIPPPTPIGD